MKITRLLASLFLVALTFCSNAGFAQPSTKSKDHKKLIQQYYAAYEKKDWHIMELILDDNFTFTSPAGDDHISLKKYKEKCWPNANNTKRFDLEKIMIDGDAALVTYNGWTNDGKLFRNTELFTFKAGKIIANECFFGTGVSFPDNKKK